MFSKMQPVIKTEHFLAVYIESKIREPLVSQCEYNNCVCEQICSLEHCITSDCFLRIVPLVQRGLTPAVKIKYFISVKCPFNCSGVVCLLLF